MPIFKELIAHDSECGAEILGFAEASRKWESIAVMQTTSCTSSMALAEFIVGLVNDTLRYGDVLDAARETLEDITNLGLNFSTEEYANEIIARIKKLRPPCEAT